MKHKIIIGAIAAIIASLGIVAPSSAIDPTFSYSEPSDDLAELTMGSNLLLAGNNVIGNQTVNGLLFSAGNNLGIRTKSDYAFVAGNIITFSAETSKDLFAAGNNIVIASQARVGRDAFLAGNTITVEADLPGNLSVAANRVTLHDVEIKGNVDLSVESLIIEGDVEIHGKLSFNSDAEVVGLSHATYAELEQYEIVENEVDTSTYILLQAVGILGLFISIVIVIALFPGLDGRIAKELSTIQFGKDLLVGMCTLLFVPIIALFLIMSFVGAPAGLVLLGTYIITIYLSQAFSGYWLGKVIVEKAFHGHLHKFLEVFIGIIIIKILALLPFIGGYVTLAAIILGLGLFMQSIKPNRKGTKTATKSHRVASKNHPESGRSSESSKDEPSKDESVAGHDEQAIEESESDPTEEE